MGYCVLAIGSGKCMGGRDLDTMAPTPDHYCADGSMDNQAKTGKGLPQNVATKFKSQNCLVITFYTQAKNCSSVELRFQPKTREKSPQFHLA